jgi:serine/threonine-protein kinase
MILELGGEKKIRPFLSTKFDESFGRISPDGKLIAYSSAETGVPQIYVRPFPIGDAKWQVSPPSISSPVWSSNGKRLIFGTATGIMGVTIAGTKAITAGEPQMFLKGYIGAQVESAVTFDVTPDGEHVLLTRPRDGEESYQKINIVMNWFSDVRNKVTSGK